MKYFIMIISSSKIPGRSVSRGTEILLFLAFMFVSSGGKTPCLLLVDIMSIIPKDSFHCHNQLNFLEHFIGCYFPSHQSTHFIPILKGEIIHVLNYELGHEDAWGSDDIAPTLLASVLYRSEMPASHPANLSPWKHHLLPMA
jgi:hypothetical protein